MFLARQQPASGDGTLLRVQGLETLAPLRIAGEQVGGEVLEVIGVPLGRQRTVQPEPLERNDPGLIMVGDRTRV